ncbi:hypothetical protein BDV97DRAFT_369020 [Delphinella strobiligena]|nr:hypothetical protein BDV97DRAFT_369020 [Delphinella strobiligena]
MSFGTLFITAPNADAKSVNRLLLHLRDWEYSDEETWDRFELITSKTLPSDVSETAPPVIDLPANKWAGKSVQDVESFALANCDWKNWKGEGRQLHIPVIVDEQGMNDGTCVLLNLVFDGEREPMQFLDRYYRVRLPWAGTYIAWCNLDIANMNFEEFCDEEKGDTGDGWWEYKAPGPYEDGEVARKRAIALKALEKLGHA